MISAQASRAAVAAARQAIADLQGPGGDTSATTFVSAVASGYEVTLCWLGDSRAYWLGQPAEESRLLTRDDSVAGGMIAAGLVDEAAAMASPHAHVLTRWLGGEAADLADDPERAPHVERFTPPGAGSLLICSDGLWNYLAEGADLARLALPKALTDPLGAAADMVKFAVDAGGADNITVVLIPTSAPRPPDLARPPPRAAGRSIRMTSARPARRAASRPAPQPGSGRGRSPFPAAAPPCGCPQYLGPTNSSSRATASRRATDIELATSNARPPRADPGPPRTAGECPPTRS